MKTIFSFSTFAKEIGFESPTQKGFRKVVNHLARIGALEIQQGGFKGDNMHHKKLIVVRDFYTILLHLGGKMEETEQKHAEKKKQEPLHMKSEPMQITERLRFVQYGTSRTHARCLYLPLDPLIAQAYNIKKGDIIKYQLLELRRAPDEDGQLEG